MCPDRSWPICSLSWRPIIWRRAFVFSHIISPNNVRLAENKRKKCLFIKDWICQQERSRWYKEMRNRQTSSEQILSFYLFFVFFVTFCILQKIVLIFTSWLFVCLLNWSSQGTEQEKRGILPFYLTLIFLFDLFIPIVQIFPYDHMVQVV